MAVVIALMTTSLTIASAAEIERWRQLSDPTDAEVAEFARQVPRLKSLSIYRANRLTARGFHHLHGIDGLQELTLGGQSFGLTDDICHSLAGLKSLDTLTLDTPIQSRQQAQILATNRSIRYMRLNGPEINNRTIEISLPLLRNLESLDLIRTRCEDRTCLMLSEKTQLTALNITGLPIRISNQGLKHLSEMKQLETLELTGSFDDQAIEALTQLKHLKALELSGNNLTADCLQPIGKIKSLETLRISGAPITDDSLRYLADSKRLTSLSLSNNRLTGSGLKHFKDLPVLKGLGLRNTRFETVHAQHLRGIKSLRYLNIDSTKSRENVHETYYVIGTLDQLTQLKGLCWDGDKEEMRKLHEKLPHLHLSNGDVSINYPPDANIAQP